MKHVHQKTKTTKETFLKVSPCEFCGYEFTKHPKTRSTGEKWYKNHIKSCNSNPINKKCATCKSFIPPVYETRPYRNEKAKCQKMLDAGIDFSGNGQYNTCNKWE